MASLLVSLHETVEDYIKNAKDKEMAGKMGSEILERCRQVVKKYKFTAEEGCKYHVTELYPMLSRELYRVIKIFHRRMKPTTTLSHPWNIRIVRNMPLELFELLKQTVLTGNYGILAKKTRSVEQLKISDLSALINWLKHVVNHAATPLLKETDILLKLLKDGSYCKAVIVSEHPFVIKYSKTQETIQFCMRYGCWNAYGVTQHVFSTQH